MKINDVQIEYFAKDEYSKPTISDLNSGDLLIQGDNRTGKTLTLNALLYNLLGSKHVIDLATGRGNKVEVDYSNGIQFYRGTPEAKFTDGSDEFTAEKARKRFSSQLCNDLGEVVSDSDLIKTHFLHSHSGRLPLARFSKEERLAVVRTVVSSDSQEEIEKHNLAISHIDSLVRRLKAKLSEDQDDRADLKREVNSARRELEKHQNLSEMLSSGRLAEINEKLERERNLRDELSEVYQRMEGLRQERRTLSKEKRQWERYHENEVNEVIARAVYDFVCPVCEHHIEEEKAENRLSGGYCPFCGEKRSLDQLKSEIRGHIDGAQDRLQEIENRTDEIESNLEELESKEEQLEEELPDIQELDSFVERALRENGYEIPGLEQKAEEGIENNKQTVEQGEAELTELHEDIEHLGESLETLDESQESAKDTVRELKDKGREHIEKFEERWSEHYERVADEISLEIRLTREGEVVLPGNTNDRSYDQDGDLSDAEARLLNVSFAVTVNEFARSSDITPWNVIVLDEPFTNLDSEGQDGLLEYLSSQEQQFIVTTSNHSLESKFKNTHRLERNTIQTTFNTFYQ